MSISAFEGAAGCGKTYSVIDYVQKKIAHAALLPHQKLLALTFMHGARMRLDGHLKNIVVLASRYEAVTLDSFVWRICHRWRARAREIGIAIPAAGDFNAHCSLAGRLLAEPDIRAWVATGYPFVLVDEAQDLHLSRLEILGELAKVCSVAIAFDDFQCLDVSNRPVAIIEWVAGRCVPTKLSVNRRTNVTDLITAAHQIRSGQAITVSGTSFKVMEAPSNKKSGPLLAATMVGYALLKSGTFALLTPSRKSRYATQIVDLVNTTKLGKNKIGPFAVKWEGGDTSVEDGIRASLARREQLTYDEAIALLQAFPIHAAINLTMGSLRRAYEASGIAEFSASSVLTIFNRQMEMTRHFERKSGRMLAMTIHQAKNREFDHVVVLWPYEVGGDAESKRRLLYNAVTRARKSCLILVQSKALMNNAPFVDDGFDTTTNKNGTIPNSSVQARRVGQTKLARSGSTSQGGKTGASKKQGSALADPTIQGS